MKTTLQDALNCVRECIPLVHNITNYVTVNDVANALLAIGGSPIMSDDAREVAEIVSICSALNINIGTLNARAIDAMHTVLDAANAQGKPVLLDPVGAGASALRTDTAHLLLEHGRFAVIRGNISEIRALCGENASTQGVDASAADAALGLDNAIKLAQNLAMKTTSIVVISGAIDVITNGSQTALCHNGSAIMGKITGAGCQLDGVIAAFLGAYALQNSNQTSRSYFEPTLAAVCAMGLAGEIAQENLAAGEGNATFRNRLIDALYGLDGATLAARARYEML